MHTLADNTTIRVSPRPPKPKKFPDDYYGEGRVEFDSAGVSSFSIAFYASNLLTREADTDHEG